MICEGCGKQAYNKAVYRDGRPDEYYCRDFTCFRGQLHEIDRFDGRTLIPVVKFVYKSRGWK